jgi:hypothetical protein
LISPLAKRIGKLADDVEKIKERQVAWEVGKVANALIEQAKQQAPNDPVLNEVEPFVKEENNENIVRLSPPEVAAILRQVAEAIPPAPMAMPMAVRGRTVMGDIATRQW